MGEHLACLWSPCVAPISVVVAGCCPLTAGPLVVGGPQRAGYMASPPEGRAAGVGAWGETGDGGRSSYCWGSHSP